MVEARRGELVEHQLELELEALATGPGELVERELEAGPACSSSTSSSSRPRRRRVTDEVCDRCDHPWNSRTDRCSNWWCDESPRLLADPFAAAEGSGRIRSTLVGPKRRRIPTPSPLPRW